jgi:GDP-mannose 6-dehydrogenase
VIGVDIAESKLADIRNGRAPLGEKGLDALIEKSVQAGDLTVTNNAFEAISCSDLSLVCVGTPSLDNGALTTGHLERVCEEIGAALAKCAPNHVVCIRSTMLPGTLNNLIKPTLEKASGLVADKDFHVAVNPEFLREGSAIQDFDQPPKIVIGTDSGHAADVIREINAGLDAPVFVIPAEVAELVKCVDNAWHATKITFGNEVGQLCRIAGVDSHALIDVFLADTQLNISPAYLRPGFAFGGSCLPKDLRALNYFARHADTDLPVLQKVLQSNTLQIERVAQRIMSEGRRKVGMFGLSFKVDTDDLRESPLVRLAEILIGKGCDLRIYDPHFDPAQVVGANKDYIENAIPHVGRLLVSEPDGLLDDVDLLVLGHNSEEARQWIKNVPDHIEMLDLVRLAGLSDKPNGTGLYW